MKPKNAMIEGVLSLLSLCGCMEDGTIATPDNKENPNDFSLEEAQNFFEQETEKLSVKPTKALAVPDGKRFSPGEFNAVWERARKMKTDSLLFYDLPIETQMRYKAKINVTDNNGKKSKEIVRIYQRLMVAKDLKTKKKAYYIMTFIPDLSSTGKVRCENFVRGKNHNNYSGLVLYLDPKTNAPIRVNRYEKGVKTGGVFLAGDLKDAVSKVNYAQNLMSEISTGQKTMVSARMYSESDWDNDDRNYNNNGGNDGWNWNDSDLVPHGDGSWLYQDKNGNIHEVIDTNGDGKPDSVLMPSVDVTPGGGSSTTNPDTDTGTDPVDPDPTPDPDYGGNSGNDTDEGGGGTSSNTIKSNIKIVYPAKDFPGYKYNGMDCYKLANYILHKLLGNSTNVEKKAYAIKTEGTRPYVTKCNIKQIISIIDSHLEANRPIKTGVDYKPDQGNNSDGITDHWIVINGRGYDSAKGQYYYIYIETGRYKPNATEAVGDNRLYYNESKGIISGLKYNKKVTYYLNQIKTNK